MPSTTLRCVSLFILAFHCRQWTLSPRMAFHFCSQLKLAVDMYSRIFGWTDRCFSIAWCLKELQCPRLHRVLPLLLAELWSWILYLCLFSLLHHLGRDPCFGSSRWVHLLWSRYRKLLQAAQLLHCCLLLLGVKTPWAQVLSFSRLSDRS